MTSNPIEYYLLFCESILIADDDEFMCDWWGCSNDKKIIRKNYINSDDKEFLIGLDDYVTAN